MVIGHCLIKLHSIEEPEGHLAQWALRLHFYKFATLLGIAWYIKMLIYCLDSQYHSTFIKEADLFNSLMKKKFMKT